MKQAFLELRHELIVDNFAGGGGASTGIEAAFGRPVDIAINHDPEAITMHTGNHPNTKHYCEDVFSVDPLVVTGGQPVGLAWFSPDCKHFSKAKGGKPVEKKIRGLAWVVIKWARAVKPRVIMLENVEEFQKWGPLLKDGRPCPARQGLTFRRWIGQLKAAGYAVEWRELKACDYGAPTIRKRLFVIARCDGRPIVWPAPTHGPKLKPYRTAAECIDWSIPCPSIFERKRPLKDATLRRIANGIRKFVIESAAPFIVNVANSKTTGRGPNAWPTDEPLRTTTASNGFAVCTPFVTKFRTGSDGSSLNEPLHTVCAGGDMKRPAGAAHAMGLITPFLAGVGGRAAQSPERSPDLPYQTITSKADAVIVAPTLIQTGYGEREGQSPRSLDLQKPLGTVVADGQKHALVAAFMAATSGPAYAQKARAVEKPINALTADTRVGVCAAFLAKHFSDKGQRPGSALDEPVGTVTSVDHHSLVTSHLLKLKGTCNDGQRVDEPIHTVQAGGNHYGEVRAFLIQYYSQGSGKKARSLDQPTPTLTATDRLGLVTIQGVEYAIVDIGMRMLQPHELFLAQGFPPNYIIAPAFNGKPMTKTAQVRMCGNSVCPPLSEALVRANFQHEQKYEAVA